MTLVLFFFCAFLSYVNGYCNYVGFNTVPTEYCYAADFLVNFYDYKYICSSSTTAYKYTYTSSNGECSGTATKDGSYSATCGGSDCWTKFAVCKDTDCKHCNTTYYVGYTCYFSILEDFDFNGECCDSTCYIAPEWYDNCDNNQIAFSFDSTCKVYSNFSFYVVDYFASTGSQFCTSAGKSSSGSSSNSSTTVAVVVSVIVVLVVIGLIFWWYMRYYRNRETITQSQSNIKEPLVTNNYNTLSEKQ